MPADPSHGKANNNLSLDSWPRLARAINEIGKELQEKFGKAPIPVGAIKKEVARLTGLKESGILPSDFCYNSKNKDPRSNRWNVFVKIGRGAYRYVGPFFDYEGRVTTLPTGSDRIKNHLESSHVQMHPALTLIQPKAPQVIRHFEGTSKWEAILQKLLVGPPVPFDKRFATRLPREPGLYGILNKEGKFLHAGVSSSLRERIFAQHFDGGGKGAASDLIQKVQDNGMAPNRTAAKQWISENCFIYWVVEHDKNVRKWAEHYILSDLQPVWGA